MSEDVMFHLAGGQNPLILVPVHVNGKGPFPFILDTGASHCALSPGLSSTLGIAPGLEKHAVGAGGPVKLSFARVSAISVGSVQTEDVDVAVTGEIERIAAAIGTEADGSLGFNFLKDFRLTLDYQRNIMRLDRNAPNGNQDGGQPASLTSFRLAAPATPLILAPVFVNGQGPFEFAVDTGASSTILAPGLARELGIQTVEVGPATGGGGQIRMFAGRVSSLAVGNAQALDHGVGVSEFLEMVSAAAGVKLDGIVGYNFLNQFQVTIDYPRSTLEFISVHRGLHRGTETSTPELP